MPPRRTGYLEALVACRGIGDAKLSEVIAQEMEELRKVTLPNESDQFEPIRVDNKPAGSGN